MNPHDRLPFVNYTPKAGHPDWRRLFEEALELANELEPRLEAPRRGADARRRRWGAYRTTASNYLRNRRLRRVGREDLRPLYFIWTTLRTCNFACTYCDDHRGRKYPDLEDAGTLDTEQGIELLRVMRTRTPSVYFAGGEPTVRADLPELTRAARDLRYFPIIVNTNGSLVHQRLHKSGWSTWLADTDVVVVSLDGLDLERLKALWVFRRPETVFRNLLLLRELASAMRFKLMVNTVIDPDALGEAREVLDLACDLGIWFCPVPMNQGPTIHPALRDNPAYDELVDLILERKRQGHRVIGSLRMNERLLRSAPLDCRNALKPHVDCDGRLAWPCKAAVNVEPEWIDVRRFESVDALYEHARGRISPDGFHGQGPEQCGAQCNWAQNYTTDAYAHGLDHPLSLLGEVTRFLGSR